VIKRTQFNNGIAGESYSFTRNVATVDDYAQAVAANVPRYGRTTLVADYTSWAVALVPAFETAQTLYGAGKSADGQHDLLAFILEDDHTFNIAKDHVFSPLLFTRNLSRTDHAGTHDIFNGTADVEATRAWVPNYAGAICHGMLVLNCSVKDWSGSAWVIKGMGVVTLAIDSTTGAVTLLRRDFIADPSVAWNDYARGAYWSMSGYTPDPHYTDPPLTAWFAMVDYAANTGSPGGYCVVFRATRAAVGSAWVPEAALMIYSSAATGRHFHTAILQVKSSTVVDVLISIGDGTLNRFILARCTDKANYTTLLNWTTYNHGTDGYANQWAGACLGPYDNHFVGEDTGSETIMSVKTPTVAQDPSVVKASHSYIFGIETAAANPTSALWVHTDCPEKKRNYVGRSFKASTGTQEESICFSPDGYAWGIIAENPTTGIVPVVCGNRIYVGTTTGQGGLRYIPIPKTRTTRPLRIGPGGKQWVAAHDWTNDQVDAGITNTSLSPKVSGKWQDGGVDLPAQPPTLGRVLKSVNASTGNKQGRNWIPGTQDVDLPRPTVADTYFRWWMMPKKGVQALVAGIIDSGEGSGTAAIAYAGSAETFIPHLHTGTAAQIPGTAGSLSYGTFLTLTAMVQGGDFYMASDNCVTGTNIVPGYPMPEVRNTTEPDEALSKSTGLALGSRWTFGVHSVIPWDSWDTTYPLVTEVPLWTLYTDANNHIAVVADIANSALLVRVTIASVLTTITIASVKYWRCHPLVVCIARTDSGVEASVRVRGTWKTGSSALSPAIPTTHKFASPDDTRAAAVDNADILWDDSAGRDAAARIVMMNMAATVAQPVRRMSIGIGMNI
jgi:hypothetical protein